MSARELQPYFLLLLLTFVVAILSRRLRAPYAVTLVLAGLAVGLPRLFPHIHLDPRTVFTLFLPPLLFESALNLRSEPLLRDWKPIAFFALVGTIVSTLVVGFLTAWLLRAPLAVGMVFGALISATDPISVLAVFKKLGANRRLSHLVEAESLFNDGVAVVLFTTALAAVSGAGAPPWAGPLTFVWMVAGGAAVGVGVGLLATRIHLELDDHLVEITLTTVVAYGSYLAAEALHVSGVIAVVAVGLLIGSHGMQTGMSPGTRMAVTSFWEYAAFLVNSLVFILIGIEAGLVHWWSSAPLALGAVAAVLVGRASIYPLSGVANRFGAHVPRAWQHILFWGGLRGALSMALALGLPPAFPLRDVLVAGTFAVVLFSLVVQGLTIGPLLRRLRLCVQRTPETEYHRLASEGLACQAALSELERLWDTEAYPNWAVKLLVERYQDRLTALQGEMRELAQTGNLQGHAQAARLERMVLLAEKSVLHEAARKGWLDEEDWRELSDRIDHELAMVVEHAGH